MHPILFKIGSFELASYGLMTAIGYGVASFYLYRRLAKINLDKETFWNLIFIIFMGALIGGKLMFIIVSWPQLGATLAEKLATVIHDIRYGFVFFGGLIVSVISVVYYMKKKKLPLLQTSDFLIVGLPLGHALGRIGCFLAGCCHGRPTDMPWGVAFTDPHSLVAPELLGIHIHPTQLYESACNFLLFFILVKLYNRPHKHGTVLLAYIACYSLVRFGIEFFRGDFRGAYVWGMSPSQLISLGAAVLAAVGWWQLSRREKNHGN